MLDAMLVERVDLGLAERATKNTVRQRLRTSGCGPVGGRWALESGRILVESTGGAQFGGLKVVEISTDAMVYRKHDMEILLHSIDSVPPWSLQSMSSIPDIQLCINLGGFWLLGAGTCTEYSERHAYLQPCANVLISLDIRLHKR